MESVGDLVHSVQAEEIMTASVNVLTMVQHFDLSLLESHFFHQVILKIDVAYGFQDIQKNRNRILLTISLM